MRRISMTISAIVSSATERVLENGALKTGMPIARQAARSTWLVPTEKHPIATRDRMPSIASAVIWVRERMPSRRTPVESLPQLHAVEGLRAPVDLRIAGALQHVDGRLGDAFEQQDLDLVFRQRIRGTAASVSRAKASLPRRSCHALLARYRATPGCGQSLLRLAGAGLSYEEARNIRTLRNHHPNLPPLPPRPPQIRCQTSSSPPPPPPPLPFRADPPCPPSKDGWRHHLLYPIEAALQRAAAAAKGVRLDGASTRAIPGLVDEMHLAIQLAPALVSEHGPRSSAILAPTKRRDEKYVSAALGDGRLEHVA